MSDTGKTRTVRLSASAVQWLAAARQAIRDHDGGLVVHMPPPADDGEMPRIEMVPVEEASDSAVIAHLASFACRWMPPASREAALKAEAARRAYIEELANAWKEGR